MPIRVEHVMGMPIQIGIPADAVDADAALRAAFAELHRADALFSTYRHDSEISRLGRGELRLADCAPEVDEVLTRCAVLREQTVGFFSVRAQGVLDPSGLVKGWAVDRAGAALRTAGITDFCINAAGDVLTAGAPAPGEPWRIGVRHPLEHDKVAAVLEGDDIAVATSGEYEQGAHIADPHTGDAPRGLLSVTVVGPELGTADALATAIFAMGAAGPRSAP
jgi:thiamine biosynthesis lipoprotein